jgi:predicted dinucleotide-binding enzyme
MVDPARVAGEHDVFLSGNDAEAKAQVGELLQSFGWPAERIVDLGDISSARGPEMYLPLWIRLRGALGTRDLNVRVVH